MPALGETTEVIERATAVRFEADGRVVVAGDPIGTWAWSDCGFLEFVPHGSRTSAVMSRDPALFRRLVADFAVTRAQPVPVARARRRPSGVRTRRAMA